MAVIIPFQNWLPKTYCCPKCMSSDLSTMVLVDAHQNPDGSWDYQPLSQEDLAYEMQNPNTRVRCENHQCGDPITKDGIRVELRENQTLLQWWLEANSDSRDFENVTFESLSKELQQEYLEWEEQLTYLHWEGVIGDCVTLEP